MAIVANNDLIRNAAALWPKIVSALKFRHKEADIAVIEDAASEAVVIFAKKIETIEHPDTPLSWLIKTAEYRYLHLHNKKKVIPLEELVVEPSLNDASILNIEDDDLLDEILFEMPNDDWRKSFQLFLEGYSIKEISEKLDRSMDATYKLTERAKERAREIATKLLTVIPIDRPIDRPQKGCQMY